MVKPIYDDDRVTDLGLFNFAGSYRAAAEALGKTKFNATHRDVPVNFLYVHALELYMKAFLRCAGETADQVVRCAASVELEVQQQRAGALVHRNLGNCRV
jgi:hypothetical protein